MRLFCAFVLAAFLSMLPLALSGGAAALAQVIQPPSPSQRQLLLEAAFVCGMFDGSFKCKAAPGGEAHGKNATPGARNETPEESPEGMTGGSEQGNTGGNAGQWTATETPAATDTACQHGMVGTPPNCACPKNSELLGGNCVHYTASACSSGLASDALPQACGAAEEKLSCTMRQDGLKDCCCLTYDKF